METEAQKAPRTHRLLEIDPKDVLLGEFLARRASRSASIELNSICIDCAAEADESIGDDVVDTGVAAGAHYVVNDALEVFTEVNGHHELCLPHWMLQHCSEVLPE